MRTLSGEGGRGVDGYESSVLGWESRRRDSGRL